MGQDVEPYILVLSRIYTQFSKKTDNHSYFSSPSYAQDLGQ